MPSIRAFIAVEIDPQTKQKISALVSSLKKSDADVKWITEDQMHLTLKFLGNVEQSKIQEISAALNSISTNFSPFTIHLSNIGAFPNINHPRVIWLGIDIGAEELKILAEKIETGLEKLGFNPSTSLGTGKEDREFKAHLTLGRVKSSKNIANLIKLLKETVFSLNADIPIEEIILFQSTLFPKGAIYTKLWTAYLPLS
ncbi:MAG: RNA 2',3'-cyclic phosphodiesterase [Candidatus Omnitrophota bacterium]